MSASAEPGALPDLLLDALACPDDGAHPLTREGAGLRCPACGRCFPCEEGLFRMLPEAPSWSTPEADAILSEREQRDRESGGYDRLLGLRLLSALEIPLTLGPLSVGAEDRVVEVGCGTGRMTLRLGRPAGVVAIDHSLASLRRLRAKAARRGRLGHRLLAVQGDATRLPVRPGWATRALSAQVVEHLPSPATRRAAIAELSRVLAPGGRLALSAYRDVPALRALMPREGYHSGRIFFHRFRSEELAGLLAPSLSVERLTGRLVYLLVAHARRESGQAGGA